MGMSASQIRYCMLQARKNDVEYQGQQINQQRTTLATQSAAHNTELLTLTVPTPPSTEQYTTTSYSFEMNGTECTIKGLSYINNDQYKIHYTTKEIKDVASRGSKFSVVYETSTDEDNVTTTTYKKVLLNSKEYDLIKTTDASAEDSDIHANNVTIIKSEEYGFNMTEDTDTYYYIKLDNGTTTYAYFRESELQAAKNQGAVAQDYVVSAQKIDVDKTKYFDVNWSETGRMSSITDTETKRTYSLDIDTVADNDAYQAAYNEYLYAKDQYNKKMDDINAKLAIIQSQDKELELQLRNLDTQENAISTEMDAVKSVTDKNIEKSFNVFG